MQGFARPESSVYERLFGNLLINPQIAKQWRSLQKGGGARNPFSVGEGPRLGGTNPSHAYNNIPSAPSGIGVTDASHPRYKVIVTAEGNVPHYRP